MEFKRQRAVVVGASRGIGRATAIALAQRGADIAVLARSVDALAVLADEIASLEGTVAAQFCDVTQPDSVKAALNRVAQRLGGVDILVNVTGIAPERAFVGDDDPHDWIATVQTNLIGPYLCCRYAMPYLRDSDHGRIVNVGSAMRGTHRSGGSAYDCSKAALWKLTQVLALEGQNHGIEVNEVIPGPVATPATPGWRVGQPIDELPGERVKTAEEVADFIVSVLAYPKGGPTGQVFSLARRPF